ncbi:hypothetical protein ACWIUD_10290 [Helicobacter sp. 23-1044]
MMIVCKKLVIARLAFGKSWQSAESSAESNKFFAKIDAYFNFWRKIWKS